MNFLSRAAVLAATLSAVAASSAGASTYSDSVLADNPGAYFRMDETGTPLTDASSNNHSGDVVGSPASVPGAIVGDSDPALLFTSQDGYSVQYAPKSAFTLETWVKFAEGTLGSTMPCDDNFWRGQSIINGEVKFYVFDYGVTLMSGHVNFGLGTNIDLHDSGLCSPGTINDGEYHLIDATWSSTDGIRALYIDGVQVASGTADNSTRDREDATQLYGGAAGLNNANSPGDMTEDEVAIYPTRLSPERIAQRYAIGTALTTAVRWRSAHARAGRSGVRVTWRTGLEADNLGFHVLKATGGRKVKLTKRLIPGGALRSSARDYAFRDRSGRPGDRYYVVERAVDGTRSLHGPIIAQR